MTWREDIETIVSGEHPRIGRSFDVVISILIVVSIIALTVESLPGLPDWLRLALRIEEVLVVIVFTMEYAMRLAAARPPLRYVFSFWGLIDLLAILPFYLGFAVDLRSARALRLLRVIRILKLFRHAKAAERMAQAFRSVQDELVVFAGIALLLLYMSAVGIYYFEHEAQPEAFASIPHSLWWAIVTLTTVGYGDVFPVTLGGRIFTFFVLLVGLGVVAVPTGLIASALTEVRRVKSDDGTG
ncbi:MAG: ion transporter [Methyloligellaceae bacterium]